MIGAVPDPTLRSVRNYTPFRRRQCQKMGKGRVFHDVVVVKATYDLRPGILPRSAEQEPVALADEYHDTVDASCSSLKTIGDLHLAKPGTDVVVTGTARPPGGRAITRWGCGVLVHDGVTALLDLQLEATGPRRWTHGRLGGWSLSAPDATIGVPIRYELAYGGAYWEPPTAAEPSRRVVHRDNPCGTGFVHEPSLDRSSSYAGPQWEIAGQTPTTINRSSPLAGFGPVARMWASRTRYGGTYDDAWKLRVREEAARGIVPDWPADFDLRFFHCAHPALRSTTPLRGHEQYMLTGLSAEVPELAFRLPDERPRAEVLPEVGESAERPMQLDLVHVDLDARRVHVTWRLVLDPADEIGAVFLTLDEGAARA